MTSRGPLLDRLLELSREPAILAPMAVGSLVIFVLSIVGVPWFVARLPADYFSRRERRELGLPATSKGGVRLVLTVLKNVVGGLLFFAGVLMLFLPGQGLLTMVAALALLDFPGKHRLQRRLVSAPPVLRALNALRRRADRPPLILDVTSSPAATSARTDIRTP